MKVISAIEQELQFSIIENINSEYLRLNRLIQFFLPDDLSGCAQQMKFISGLNKDLLFFCDVIPERITFRSDRGSSDNCLQ
jgi:hypothetical protein